MNRLRWLAILVPAVLVGGIELLSDTFLDPFLPFPVDTALIAAVVLVTAAILSHFAFGQIDRLDAALRTRNAELEARNASARALYGVSVAIAAMAQLDDILQAIVDNARRLLDGDLALLWLVGPTGGPRLRARSGGAPEVAETGQRNPLDSPSNGAQMEAPLTEVPLLRGDETIGTLAVRRPPGRPASDDELTTLASLASQAAIAIEADRLQLELRELAVRGERERIARELHDGLAQVLGYVNTKSQAVDELLAAGRIEDARSQLAELAAAARSLYVDVREAILGLRGPVTSGAGLAAALRVYGRRFADASKLAVRVEAADAATRLEIDPAIEDEAFRVVREALTNVRKHAAAGRVVIRLDVVDGWLVIEVEDDGRGFDPAAVAPSDAERPQLGLAGIRERAASTGGHVEWRTGPTGGTIVRLTIPIEPEPDPAAAGSSAAVGTAR